MAVHRVGIRSCQDLVINNVDLQITKKLLLVDLMLLHVSFFHSPCPRVALLTYFSGSLVVEVRTAQWLLWSIPDRWSQLTSPPAQSFITNFLPGPGPYGTDISGPVIVSFTFIVTCQEGVVFLIMRNTSDTSLLIWLEQVMFYVQHSFSLSPSLRDFSTKYKQQTPIANHENTEARHRLSSTDSQDSHDGIAYSSW